MSKLRTKIEEAIKNNFDMYDHLQMDEYALKEVVGFICTIFREELEKIKQRNVLDNYWTDDNHQRRIVELINSLEEITK